MVLEKGSEDGRPVVVEVFPEGPADRRGVRVGDTVVAVEGNAVSAYEDFLAVHQAVGRPLVLRLERPTRPSVSPSLHFGHTSLLQSSSSYHSNHHHHTLLQLLPPPPLSPTATSLCEEYYHHAFVQIYHRLALLGLLSISHQVGGCYPGMSKRRGA